MTLEVPHSGVSVYIHVPFCATKCAYCDFHSQALGVRLPPSQRPARRELGADGAFPDPVDEFMAGLKTLPLAAPLLTDVPTLYVGGGTPTVIGDRLIDVLDAVREAGAVLRPGAEVTVEANPESVTESLLRDLAEWGVTRVSLGVQSFDDDVLKTLGRCHDAEAARRAARAVVDAGLRLSVDLMCAIPGQTAESWGQTLGEALATGAGHASVYPLAVEEATPIAAAIDRGELPEPDPDVAADMMVTAETALASAGLARYEVANYARPDEESLHNLRYWTGGSYLGVGPSAASMLTSEQYGTMAAVFGPSACGDGARIRFVANTMLGRPPGGFAGQGLDAAPDELECLTAAEAAREDAMLGLRTVAGIDDALASRAGVEAELQSLVADGLLIHADGRWSTTRRGWLLGNQVFGRIWNG